MAVMKSTCTVEPPFRGHPWDRGKCPLHEVVPWTEVSHRRGSTTVMYILDQT